MSSKEIKKLIKFINNNNPGLCIDSKVLLKIQPIYLEDGYNTVWEIYSVNINNNSIIHTFVKGKYTDVTSNFDCIL